MNLQEAKSLKAGTFVFELALRTYTKRSPKWKVTSVKTWKRQPDRVEVHIKHGLYDFGYFNETQLDQWSLTDPSKKKVEPATDSTPIVMIAAAPTSLILKPIETEEEQLSVEILDDSGSLNTFAVLNMGRDPQNFQHYALVTGDETWATFFKIQGLWAITIGKEHDSLDFARVRVPYTDKIDQGVNLLKVVQFVVNELWPGQIIRRKVRKPRGLASHGKTK